MSLIERVMRRDFVSADPEESVESARQTMRLARLRHLVVIRNGCLVGILSYRDLLERLLAAREAGIPGPKTVGELMTRDPSFVTPATDLATAADAVYRFGFGCLPVLAPELDGAPGNGRPVGIVTEGDLLRAVYARRSG